MDAEVAAAPKKASNWKRSPSFPYIGLNKAVGRIKEMDSAHKEFETSMAAAAQTWGWAPKSSSLLQTVAALKAYGLLTDSGSGVGRKVQVTDLARQILHDARPGKKEAALKEAATKPKLLSEYVKKWGANRPVDAHCISELRMDRGFSDDAAKTFLKVYDLNSSYASTSDADSVVSHRDDGSSEGPSVGDFVQWTSRGQLQWKQPWRVERIDTEDSSGEKFLWCVGQGEYQGQSGYIPMNEASIEAPPADGEVGSNTPKFRLPSGRIRDSASIEATLPLDEGVASLTWPKSLSQESFEDFQDWVELMLRRAKRSISNEKEA